MLALLAGCLLVLLSLSRGRPEYVLTVKTIAVANAPSGVRQAAFQVVNSGRYTVVLLPTYVLENRSGRWRTNDLPKRAVTLETNLMGVLPFDPSAKPLKPGESCTLAVPLPFDDLGWRASFWYLRVSRPLIDDAQQLLARIGLRKRDEGQQIVSTPWSDTKENTETLKDTSANAKTLKN